MKAMILAEVASLDAGRNPLQLVDLPVPEPGPGEILIRVSACGPPAFDRALNEVWTL